ncbi:hypothetical protein A2Z33_04935 [Candidatus Gottesmanbacteria bacterium RBG_16_52_11]|uniref:Glycosyl transferase family 1 domain-containing protein n=1 Tax=Candidatus Gottesmanbacteria bacterium RBG_16_52_11 TaxID=1798374 RepID=A0A1F5YUB8_9BACT|nr:MAG: hypothetical protein A2Z33_04935 [Candidatus Gottesmanbacteria bacterium RBG_16_52_11]
MRIGIDARLIHETGVGRYIRNLISAVARHDRRNRYFAYLTPEASKQYKLPHGWESRVVGVRWHTLREQAVMADRFRRDRLDLVHVPYFNAPVLYPGKFVLTIHDLTVLHFATGRATMLPIPLYYLRRAGYRAVMSVGLRRASAVLAVSRETEKELGDHYPFVRGKVTVTREGVDAAFIKESAENPDPEYTAEPPYFLYVGNAYPHKNLGRLADSFRIFRDRSGGADVKMVFVGAEDPFYARLKNDLRGADGDAFRFFGPVEDRTLLRLYRHAVALVFPSLMEGFGLPVLEALSVGCPVLASDIGVFREVGDGFVNYFDPQSLQSMADAMTQAFGKYRPGSKRSVTAGLAGHLSTFSWDQLGRQTVKVYNSV